MWPSPLRGVALDRGDWNERLALTAVAFAHVDAHALIAAEVTELVAQPPPIFLAVCRCSSSARSSANGSRIDGGGLSRWYGLGSGVAKISNLAARVMKHLGERSDAEAIPMRSPNAGILATLTIRHLLAVGSWIPAYRRILGGPVFDEDLRPRGGPGLDQDYQIPSRTSAPVAMVIASHKPLASKDRFEIMGGSTGAASTVTGSAARPLLSMGLLVSPLKVTTQ